MSTPATTPENSDVANRRRQLRRWIEIHYGGVQARFSAQHEINAGELSGLLKQKSFGEKRARRLEEQAGMPSKYLEQRPSPVQHYSAEEPTPAALTDATLSDHWPFRRVRAHHWQALTEAQRTHVEDGILLLLGQKHTYGTPRKSANGH